MNENITINAVKFITLWTLEKVFVDVHERPLTSEAIHFLFLVEDFNKVQDGKEVMIGASKMRRENECQSTNDTQREVHSTLPDIVDRNIRRLRVFSAQQCPSGTCTSIEPKCLSCSSLARDRAEISS
jgi:hypothetical protein